MAVSTKYFLSKYIKYLFIRHKYSDMVSMERFVPDLQKDVPWAEMHFERYRFASKYLLSDDNVMDIACGVGYGVKILAPFCNSILGIDRSTSSIRYAIENYGDYFKVGDFFEFKGNAGVVVSFETIEHIPASLNRILKSLLDRANRLLIGSIPYLEKPGNPYHCHYMLNEDNLIFLNNYGKLEFFYQEREPGYKIYKDKFPLPQNLIFVLHR
jgi:Methyltransferase domain